MTGPFSCIPQYGLSTLETPWQECGLTSNTDYAKNTWSWKWCMRVTVYVKAISLDISVCDKLQLIKKGHPNKGSLLVCLWSLMKQDGSNPFSCHVQWQSGRHRMTLLLMKHRRKCSSLINNAGAVIEDQSTTIRQDRAAIKEAPNTDHEDRVSSLPPTEHTQPDSFNSQCHIQFNSAQCRKLHALSPYLV